MKSWMLVLGISASLVFALTAGAEDASQADVEVADGAEAVEVASSDDEASVWSIDDGDAMAEADAASDGDWLVDSEADAEAVPAAPAADAASDVAETDDAMAEAVIAESSEAAAEVAEPVASVESGGGEAVGAAMIQSLRAGLSGHSPTQQHANAVLPRSTPRVFTSE